MLLKKTSFNYYVQKAGEITLKTAWDSSSDDHVAETIFLVGFPITTIQICFRLLVNGSVSIFFNQKPWFYLLMREGVNGGRGREEEGGYSVSQ